jgi:hypothetical protein
MEPRGTAHSRSSGLACSWPLILLSGRCLGERVLTAVVLAVAALSSVAAMAEARGERRRATAISVRLGCPKRSLEPVPLPVTPRDLSLPVHRTGTVASAAPVQRSRGRRSHRRRLPWSGALDTRGSGRQPRLRLRVARPRAARLRFADWDRFRLCHGKRTYSSSVRVA